MERKQSSCRGFGIRSLPEANSPNVPRGTFRFFAPLLISCKLTWASYFAGVNGFGSDENDFQVVRLSLPFALWNKMQNVPGAWQDCGVRGQDALGTAGGTSGRYRRGQERSKERSQKEARLGRACEFRRTTLVMRKSIGRRSLPTASPAARYPRWMRYPACAA